MDPILADFLKSLVPLAAVGVTWLLATRGQRLQKRREAIASWHALLVEVNRCQEQLRGIVETDVLSPLYRLSTSTYETRFHTLMVDSDIEPAEIDLFRRYYGFVEQVNLGLDLAMAALQRHDTQAMTKESRRYRGKARKVVEKEGTPESPFDQVRSIIYRHLQRLGDTRYVAWLKNTQAPRLGAAPPSGPENNAEGDQSGRG